MTGTEKSLNEILYQEIKALIAPLKQSRNITENEVLRAFYEDTQARFFDNDVKEENFIQRNKMCKLRKLIDPDKLSALLYYIETKYSISNSVTPQDRDAAYEFDIELCNRVATVPIDSAHGCDQTVLTSIYTLFDTQRSLCRKYRFPSLKFRTLSEEYLNTVVRPFTSKWHPIISSGEYDRKIFRIELKELQAPSREFSSRLREIFGFG